MVISNYEADVLLNISEPTANNHHQEQQFCYKNVNIVVAVLASAVFSTSSLFYPKAAILIVEQQN